MSVYRSRLVEEKVVLTNRSANQPLDTAVAGSLTCDLSKSESWWAANNQARACDEYRIVDAVEQESAKCCQHP